MEGPFSVRTGGGYAGRSLAKPARSPIVYLTQYRTLLIDNLLSRGSAPLSRIAEDVGYQTDTAFIHGFRRDRI